MESNKKKLNTPVKENSCKNLFQTPKNNQNEGNDFENDGIQMKVCCPSGEKIPQCDSESIEINDMIDLLLKVLKSLKDVGQKESFLKFMRLLSTSFTTLFRSTTSYQIEYKIPRVLERNINKSNQNSKSHKYLVLVRPKQKYPRPVHDPHTAEQNNKIGMIKR
jgi:hypothetical protein